jgi:hypothetical protein
LLLGGSPARGEPIHWTASWSALPENVHAGTGAASLSLSNESPVPVTGNSDLVATNVQTHAPALGIASDPTVKADYALQLHITDQDSGASGTLTFHCEITGSLGSDSSILQNAYVGPTTQTLVLGQHLYTVRLGDFSPPGPPSSSSSGSISARATVQAQTILQNLPEPAGLVHGALGLSVLALCRRRGVARRGASRARA